jgi:hypothetical protein
MIPTHSRASTTSCCLDSALSLPRALAPVVIIIIIIAPAQPASDEVGQHLGVVQGHSQRMVSP